MPSRDMNFGLTLQPTDRLQLLVTDTSLARAFYEGVPAARLLARTRIASDEHDMGDRGNGESSMVSTWDRLMRRLIRENAPLDRLKRSVARHTRAASSFGRMDCRRATAARPCSPTSPSTSAGESASSSWD